MQYSCESRPCLTLSGALSCAGGTQRSGVGRADGFNCQFSRISAVFSPYFRLNNVDKSYRKAIINYLRKSKAKIGENRRKSAKIGENRRKAAKIGGKRRKSAESGGKRRKAAESGGKRRKAAESGGKRRKSAEISRVRVLPV